MLKLINVGKATMLSFLLEVSKNYFIDKGMSEANASALLRGSLGVVLGTIQLTAPEVLETLGFNQYGAGLFLLSAAAIYYTPELNTGLIEMIGSANLMSIIKTSEREAMINAVPNCLVQKMGSRVGGLFYFSNKGQQNNPVPQNQNIIPGI